MDDGELVDTEEWSKFLAVHGYHPHTIAPFDDVYRTASDPEAFLHRWAKRYDPFRRAQERLVREGPSLLQTIERHLEHHLLRDGQMFMDAERWSRFLAAYGFHPHTIAPMVSVYEHIEDPVDIFDVLLGWAQRHDPVRQLEELVNELRSAIASASQAGARIKI